MTRTPEEIRELVLGMLLERERDHFWDEPPASANADAREPFERHVNLLLVATMMLGVELKDLKEKATEEAADLLPSFGAARPRFDADRYSRMSGRDSARSLAPLQPDLFGEYFCLHRLEELAARNEHQPLIDFALRLGRDRSAAFLVRAALDFPVRFQALGYLKPSPTTGPEGLLAYCAALIDITNLAPTRGNMELALSFFEVARAFEKIEGFVEPVKRGYYLAIAEGAANLANAFGDVGEVDRELVEVERVKKLALELDNVAFWRTASRAAANFVIDLSRADREDDAMIEAKWTRDLAETHNDIIIWRSSAKSSVIVINILWGRDDINGMISELDHLKYLAASNDDYELWIQCGNGATIVAAMFALRGEMDSAQSEREMAEALLSSYPDDELENHVKVMQRAWLQLEGLEPEPPGSPAGARPRHR